MNIIKDFTGDFKYFDAFTGIGGFTKAIQDAIPNAKCVGYSEVDKYAIQTYEKHYPEHKNYGDITKIIASELPDFDCFVGGFPCQAFSIAGKRAGFNDTRGTLFFDIARIIKKKRTKYLLLENVKGLLSHDSGRTFKTILSTLTELGYDIQTMVLNSKNFGVPQNRERVFIVGNLRGTSRPKVFPIGTNSKKDGITYEQGGTPENQVADTLTVHYAKNQHGNQYVAEMLELTSGVSDAMRIYSLGAVGKGMSGQVDSIKGIARTLKGLGGGLGAKTGLYQINAKIRRLTPIECERLQGFPDNWTQGVSDTQRYKQLGNAVTVNVVEEIAKRAFRDTND